MSLKTILGWLALAFIVWWIIIQPHGAAQVVANIGHFLTSAAHSLSNLFAPSSSTQPARRNRS